MSRCKNDDNVKRKNIFKKIERDFVIVFKINSDKHTSRQDKTISIKVKNIDTIRKKKFQFKNND